LIAAKQQQKEEKQQHEQEDEIQDPLISPSLHTGLDLKNELSRFQIITKVPYPNKSDRRLSKPSK